VSNELIAMIVGYLIGSVSFALLVSKFAGRGDIRSYGSGNAGASNVARNLGWKAGVLTLLGDVLKGALAVYIGGRISPGDGALLAGAGAFIGHRYPLYFGLKGGKCAATLGGVFLAIDIRIALCYLAAWIVIMLVTRYAALATSIGCWALPVASYYFRPDIPRLHIYAVMLCWLLVFFHRDNFKRLRRKTEPRLDFKRHENEEKYG